MQAYAGVGGCQMSDREQSGGARRQPKVASPLASRAIMVQGREQAVRLEPSYWEALDEICRREEICVDELCTDLASRIEHPIGRRGPLPVTLANAIRVFIVGYYRQAATEYGHRHAGHGLGDPFAVASEEREPVRH